MKFGVIVFPGSNCDQDMVYNLRNQLDQEVVELWHKDTDLQNCDAIVVPGGFSYGDYLRSGAIAKFSPIMEEVIKFANNGGFVFGVCNGFQILCESGLLPGTLMHNESHKFICKNVYIKPNNTSNALTAELEDKAYLIPIAHAEGKYFADDETMANLKANNQILFQYCDAEGNINAESNPNGSLENIAGVCNANKNVFGMMPHPERAADAVLGNTDGLGMFQSLINHMVQA